MNKFKRNIFLLSILCMIQAVKSCPKNCHCTENGINVACTKLDIQTANNLPNTTKFLDLSNTELDSLPAEQLRHLKELQTLNLSSNKFNHIPNNLSIYFPGLTELFMIGNQVDIIKPLQGLQTLHKLELRRNSIKEIEPLAFVKLKNLELLSLDQNNITSIPSKAFVGLDNLRYLYIRNNQIRNFHNDAFRPLPKLELLYLDDNKLEAIPDDSFGHTKQLTVILHKNNINYIGKNAFGTVVRTIDLRYNKLSNIPVSVFSRLSVTYRIFMNGLQCNCALIKILRTDLSPLYKNDKIIVEECLSSSTNDTLDFYWDKFDCAGEKNTYTVIIVLAVIVFLLIISSLLIVLCEMKRTRWLGGSTSPPPPRFQQLEFEDELL